jgi:NAD(P)-dependent dehydrogenase (short-subunit alcohol dehydrogenase family)
MSLELFDLTGKVAMVTGSTRGLGEVTAKALAKAGADVAVCGRNRADLDRVSAAIKDLGRNSSGFALSTMRGLTTACLCWNFPKKPGIWS